MVHQSLISFGTGSIPATATNLRCSSEVEHAANTAGSMVRVLPPDIVETGSAYAGPNPLSKDRKAPHQLDKR